MEDGRSPYAIRLSEADSGTEPVIPGKTPLRSLPLYAAYCIGADL